MYPPTRLNHQAASVYKKYCYGVLCLVLFGLVVKWLFGSSGHQYGENAHYHTSSIDFYHRKAVTLPYNDTYPLTKPQIAKNWKKYRIGVITDLDENSKSTTKKNSWVSYYRRGYLTVNNDHRSASVEWDSETITLTSTLAQKGRGMELSELVVFNGKLLAFDDRTGVVFEILEEKGNVKAVPWVLLIDGNGKVEKGFKTEWACVKSKTVYAGGLGKEWTTPDTGKILNYDPMWVKSIGPHGDIAHHNWYDRYITLRRSGLGIELPGYVIHESANWSEKHQRWFFLPRRASHKTYDEVSDERRATNVLISCTEDFQDVRVSTIGKLNPTHGFSSFKFIPDTMDDLVVALKTEEDRGNISSYILVFNLAGEIIMEESKIGDVKYEGVEFI